MTTPPPTRIRWDQLDRAGRRLVVVAAVGGAGAGALLSLWGLSINRAPGFDGARSLWWVVVGSAVVVAILSVVLLRHSWKVEGGRAAKLELDTWIRDARLPTDVAPGAAVARLSKRADRTPGPVYSGFLAAIWTLMVGLQFATPDDRGGLAGVLFRAAALAFFLGNFVRALRYSRRQGRVVAALIQEGKRRLVEPPVTSE